MSLLALGMFTLGGVAQPAAIEGWVTDSQYRPISPAHISVTDQAGKIAGQADGDSKGHYRIRGISSGLYDITLTLPGTSYLGGTTRSEIRLEGLCLNWTASQKEKALGTRRRGATFRVCNPALAAAVAGVVIDGGVVAGLAISGVGSNGSALPPVSPAL